ncbi:MAG: bifunctional diguanylate cyclase/phosphodiesterase, partial [Acidimicrobiia bacterium]|nr:bifunctional diguanylate cyclase/phosphodiesterase [Acidimicrobiia bacterium]
LPAMGGENLGFLEVYRATTVNPANDEWALHSLVARIAALLIERSQYDSNLTAMASIDPLTGLGNRNRLTAEFNRPLAEIACVVIDIDDFSWINNTLGHEAGDRLITAAAERILACLPTGAVACRTGGDEFAVILRDEFAKPERAIALAKSIANRFSLPVHIGPLSRHLGMSIGVATGDAGSKPSDVLALADASLYDAKKSGGRCVRYYDDRLAMEQRRQRRVAGELARALAHDELFLDYQPMVDVSDNSLIGVEALVRWDHPEWGQLGPDQFIDAADAAGLSRDLDAWVLDAATAQMHRWLDAHSEIAERFIVWVNISVRNLGAGTLVDRLMDRTGPERAGNLGIELTERAVVTDAHSAAGELSTLRAAGFRVAIDDIGTGTASLDIFRTLDVDVVKIDRSFVRDIEGDRRTRALVDSIVGLAHRLGTAVTAEGIETPEQRRIIDESGCDSLQGFLLARPATTDIIDTILVGTASGDARQIRPPRVGGAVSVVDLDLPAVT